MDLLEDMKLLVWKVYFAWWHAFLRNIVSECRWMLNSKFWNVLHTCLICVSVMFYTVNADRHLEQFEDSTESTLQTIFSSVASH